MSQRKMEGIKIIANAYKVVKPLFQVRSYLYAQICCLKNNYEVVNAALYVYENEDPSQSLKMLSEKLDYSNKHEYSNLIFPYQHVKDSFNDKNISLFFIKDYLVPFRYYEKKPLTIQQSLEILHGALSCLNHLHLRDIVHGNISLSTCYLVRQQEEGNCKFAFNILDTTYFTEEDCIQGIEDRLFSSEGQSLGLKVSFKDDLQSLVYVMTHLISRGKIFTLQRFQLEWITQAEFLRWKSCDFFKEMIQIIPPELEILVELYTIAKSLRRNEKADYLKLMKKIMLIMSNKDHKTIKTSHKQNEMKSNSNKTTKTKKNSQNESINEDEIVIKIDKIKSKEATKIDRIKQNESTFNQTKKEKSF